MLTKELRNKILEKYTNKEDKIFVASIIDLALKFETSNHTTYTSFLNLYEKEIAINVLNSLKVEYTVFLPVADCERCIIFFIPEYEEYNKNIYNEYITCLKISPNSRASLKHKDYMGAILNSGTAEKMIGDIYVVNNVGYVFMLKSLENYFLNNLLYVSRNEVKTSLLDLNSDEVLSLHYTHAELTITIPSTRIDVILAGIYNLSRSEVKTKIENGDLIINSKEMYFQAYNVKENDIISFRKCGKTKIGNVLRTTKSGNLVLQIFKYT